MEHWKNNRQRRNSWFDEECQIILKDEKKACNKMIDRNTRRSEQEYKDKRKETHEIFRQKKRGLFKSKLEQIELFIITLKQRNFIKKWIV